MPLPGDGEFWTKIELLLTIPSASAATEGQIGHRMEQAREAAFER